MQLNPPQSNPAVTIGAPVLPADWRKPLAILATIWVAIFVLTFPAWVAMADQWWNISTYNHVLFVPLIVGWLVWTRWPELSRLTPQGWWPGLIVLAAALVTWLLGSIAGVNTVAQIGAVGALQAAVLALLGPRVTVGVLFPLAYMTFLVPFGDELVPALQMITAELTIALTHLSGVPAEIDGVFIDTPVGLFEVAEACSGVKFLIAMIALGTLVAQTCFTSWKRRLTFMAVAIALPILANGVRAWGTIYIAQSQGIEFAQGFDHIFYGWVFFALVVGALLAGSWHWFDRQADDTAVDPEMLAKHPILTKLDRFTADTLRLALAAFAMIAAVGAWNGAAATSRAALPERIALPQVPGWQRSEPGPTIAWEPRAAGADRRFIGQYRNNSGARVDVFVAIYATQEKGAEATATGEGALRPDTDWRWLSAGAGSDTYREDILLAQGRVKRIAATSYRQGDLLTGSALRLKLANMSDRIALRSRPTIMLILSAEDRPGHDAQASLAAFRDAIAPTEEWLDAAAGLR